LISVAIGGVIGTSLRLAIDAVLHHSDSEFPWSTLIINVVGSFVLGALVSRLWPIAPAWVRAGLGPGLLGSFTTFSAVMVSFVTLTVSRHVELAVVYLAASVIFGFAAAALGLRVGRRPGALTTIEVDE
jgi:CrcB protein